MSIESLFTHSIKDYIFINLKILIYLLLHQISRIGRAKIYLLYHNIILLYYHNITFQLNMTVYIMH